MKDSTSEHMAPPFTNPPSTGSGALGASTPAGAADSASFLALTPNRRFLYAVNETAGFVLAFSVNASTGALTFLNQQSSNGSGPAHVVVDRSGTSVFVSNYGGGSVTVFPILPNGQLGSATAHVQHPGTSPHAHCVTLDRSNHFAFVCDLGLDQLRSYVFNPAAGSLVTNTALITPFPAGSGPRHMVFHPNADRAYVICETSSTVVGFNYNPTNGILTSFQTVSTLLPGGFQAPIPPLKSQCILPENSSMVQTAEKTPSRYSPSTSTAR